MNTYEIIKELAKEKGLSIRQLEINFGYSNGYLGSWKRQTPNSKELSRIADYFNVTVDYLLGRTENVDRKLGARGELLAAHIDDDVSEKDMQDILNYIEFRKNNPL